MENTFTPIQLYTQAFNTVPYLLPRKGSFDVPVNDKTQVPAKPARKEVGQFGSYFYDRDAIGREYFCPVTITLPPPEGSNTSEIFTLDYPVIRLQGSASIVSTPMVERKGAVHEIISTDDYDIVIRGIIVNHSSNDLDDERVNRYFDLLETGKTITLRSVITDRPLSPDYKAIIKKVMLPEFFGVQNVMRYEIELISDFIFELTLS